MIFSSHVGNYKIFQIHVRYEEKVTVFIFLNLFLSYTLKVPMPYCRRGNNICYSVTNSSILF